MKKILPLLLLGIFISSHGFSQDELEGEEKKERWLIEPIKITSLMVNTHSEYNGWGFEVGRRITDNIWATSMIEKTQGGDFIKNFDPNYDYLITFSYFAWLNTARYFLKPEAKYTWFADAGFELQTASHMFLRNNEVFSENALAIGPIVFVGGELAIGNRMHFKWRMGGFLNLHRSGAFTERINDGQDQPSFYLYPHLSDAVISKGTYAGDVAFGIKF